MKSNQIGIWCNWGKVEVPELTPRAGETSTMELVVAHVMAMETSSPIMYVGVQEEFIILSNGKIWRIRGTGFIRNVEVGRECGVFIS